MVVAITSDIRSRTESCCYGASCVRFLDLSELVDQVSELGHVKDVDLLNLGLFVGAFFHDARDRGALPVHRYQGNRDCSLHWQT